MIVMNIVDNLVIVEIMMHGILEVLSVFMQSVYKS